MLTVIVNLRLQDDVGIVEQINIETPMIDESVARRLLDAIESLISIVSGSYLRLEDVASQCCDVASHHSRCKRVAGGVK